VILLRAKAYSLDEAPNPRKLSFFPPFDWILFFMSGPSLPGFFCRNCLCFGALSKPLDVVQPVQVGFWFFPVDHFSSPSVSFGGTFYLSRVFWSPFLALQLLVVCFAFRRSLLIPGLRVFAPPPPPPPPPPAPTLPCVARTFHFHCFSSPPHGWELCL